MFNPVMVKQVNGYDVNISATNKFALVKLQNYEIIPRLYSMQNNCLQYISSIFAKLESKRKSK
jgi:hypothetical protein